MIEWQGLRWRKTKLGSSSTHIDALAKANKQATQRKKQEFLPSFSLFLSRKTTPRDVFSTKKNKQKKEKKSVQAKMIRRSLSLARFNSPRSLSPPLTQDYHPFVSCSISVLNVFHSYPVFQWMISAKLSPLLSLSLFRLNGLRKRPRLSILRFSLDSKATSGS